MAEKDDYVFTRDYAEGLRLDTQHLLYNLHNGYTIDPKIPITPDTKIADIGTGTGIWLLDVATQVPPTVQLDGFDIADDQLPHKSNIPSNMSFRKMDALAPVPDEFVEKYDIVHMRLWVCIIKGGDPSALIQHAKQLLKPGGYLQWDDANLGKLYIKGPEAEAFAEFSRKSTASYGFDFTWLDEFPSHLEKGGLEVLKFRADPISKALVPLATRPFIMGHVAALDQLYKTPRPDLPSRQEAATLFSDLIGSIKHGGALYQTLLSILARKPFRS